MLKFEEIHDDIIPVLKKNGIQEKDLFLENKESSNLYIGCKNRAQARKILTGGKWKAMSDIFIPQQGSDMDHYPAAVDIWGGYIKWFENKMSKHTK